LGLASKNIQTLTFENRISDLQNLVSDPLGSGNPRLGTTAVEGLNTSLALAAGELLIVMELKSFVK